MFVYFYKLIYIVFFKNIKSIAQCEILLWNLTMHSRLGLLSNTLIIPITYIKYGNMLCIVSNCQYPGQQVNTDDVD